MTSLNYENYHRDKEYEESKSLFRNIFQKRFNLVFKYKKSGKVLDIGASNGTFLKIFKEKGFDVVGVEPSKSGEYAKRLEIKIIRDYFENVRFAKNSFDIVVMNHTLEHVKDAEGVLKKIFRVLKKDGILLIDVPNAGGFGSILLGEAWPYRLPLEHNYQFTKQNLGSLLKQVGFRIIYWESRSGLYEYANPLQEILSSLINFKKRFFTDILTFPYATVATFLKRGDSMSFVVKKK